MPVSSIVGWVSVGIGLCAVIALPVFGVLAATTPPSTAGSGSYRSLAKALWWGMAIAATAAILAGIIALVYSLWPSGHVGSAAARPGTSFVTGDLFWPILTVIIVVGILGALANRHWLGQYLWKGAAGLAVVAIGASILLSQVGVPFSRTMPTPSPVAAFSSCPNAVLMRQNEKPCRFNGQVRVANDSYYPADKVRICWRASGATVTRKDEGNVSLFTAAGEALLYYELVPTGYRETGGAQNGTCPSTEPS